jgi:biotin carboxyl carrier protein
MENEVTAHRAGTIGSLAVAPGQAVSIGEAICVIAADGAV